MINPILQTEGSGNSSNNIRNTGYNRGNSGTKKIILIMIIVLVSIIVVGGGVFAYTYFFTDAFLSEEQGFYKYISQNSQIIDMFKDEDLNGYMKKIQNEAYSSNGELTLSFNGDIEEKSKKIVDEIEKHKITFNSNIDNVNKYLYNGLGLKYGENDVISGAFVKQNDYFGFKVNDIGLNPYIVLENNNLKQFAKNLGLSDEEIASIPDKIHFENLTNEQLFTKEELAGIKDRYLKAITDNLTEEMFSKNEQDGIDVYTLTITEEKGKVVTSALMNTLKNDDVVLNKLKQLYIEQSSATEEEAQALIDSLKSSLDEAVNELNGTSSNTDTYQNLTEQPNPMQPDVTQSETTEEPENLYINVYVSKKNLVKTEVFIENEGKIVINNNDNNVLLEIIELEKSNDTQLATEVNSSKVLASIKLEKNKTDSELLYKLTLSSEEKELIIMNLTYTGLKEMTNVGANLLVDLDLSDIIYVYSENSILSQAQDAKKDTINVQEEESIRLAMMKLIVDIYADSYTSDNEIVMNEKTLKKALEQENLDVTVSRNEDGTYRVQSNTTGNIYTVDSQGNVTTTEIAKKEDEETITEPEEKTIKVSLSLNGTTTFGSIQQELSENNIYKLNDKSLEQLEGLFTQLGDRVLNKITSAYQNSPMIQTFIQH